MTKVLAGALVPIFAGLLLGYWAGRRGLMDSINIRNLIVFCDELRCSMRPLFDHHRNLSRSSSAAGNDGVCDCSRIYRDISGMLFLGALSCRHVHPRWCCARFDLRIS
jgi:hypothetical protein